jgi:epoxyqueuosine reductase QueG
MATQQALTTLNNCSAEIIRQICREAGADEVGLVEVGRPALAQEREGIRHVYPATQTVISLSRAINRENMQSTARPAYNGEMHRVEDDLCRISGEVLRQLNARGIRGVSLNPAFPMDMNRWPGKTWDVGHKTTAVAAGLGVMGLNCLVLSPRFGSAIILNSILINAQVDHYDQPLEHSPCIKCGLCVAVCPTGAVHKDGAFDFLACATHSYRDLSGALDWVDALLASQDLAAYQSRFQDRDTMSLWQGMMFGFNHKCGYCQSVCPVGDVGMSRYQVDQKSYLQEVLKPLQERAEPVYVVAGSQAATRVRGNPAKDIWYVKSTRKLN